MTGNFTIYSIPGTSNSSTGITAGPDGNIWFTEDPTNQIGRLTPSGVLTQFTIPTPNSNPNAITLGPDNNLWFTEPGANQIASITTAGVITEYPVPTPNSGLRGMVTGPDGNLWFTEYNANQIGRFTPGPQGRLGPQLTVNNLTVSGSNGAVVSNSGTFADTTSGATITAMSASAGTVVQNSNGTWSWSETTPSGAAQTAAVTIYATDSNGQTAATEFWLNVGQVFTVTNTGDNGGVNPAPGAGTGTLRQAILDADNASNTGEPSLMAFAVPTTDPGYNPATGTFTIAPLSALPSITNSVVIDGYTQPGARPNTLSEGDNAVLKVQLDGVSAGAGVNGLTISGTNVTVQGLNIASFGGNAIDLTGAGGDTIQGNYIGTDITATDDQMPAAPVSLWLANGNANDSVGTNNGTLAGYQPGDTAFMRTGGVQAFNFDGIDDSITVPDAPSLDITGSVSVDALVKVGAFNPLLTWIAGQSGAYQLNLTPDGRAIFSIDIAGTGTFVGAFGSTHLTPGVLYNLAGTYDQSTGAISVYVNGVLDGTNSVAPGTADAPNSGPSPFQIGGLEGFGYPNYPQLFIGQIGDVSLYNRALSAAEIQAMTNLAGNVAPGNGTGVFAGSGNLIGGITAAARNIISGNQKFGVADNGPGDQIQGNLIGTDVTGMSALGNAEGIYIGSSTTIGGTTAAARNIISGNSDRGIFIGGSGGVIEGNYIGTDITDTAAVGNGFGLNGNGAVTIGGTAPGAGTLSQAIMSASVLKREALFKAT